MSAGRVVRHTSADVISAAVSARLARLRLLTPLLGASGGDRSSQDTTRRMKPRTPA